MSTGITSGASPKKIQTTFRVDEKMYNRMHSEAVKREVSIQEMILYALQIYWRTPRTPWDYAELKFVSHDNEQGRTQEEIDVRNHWLELWKRYTDRMPREKVEMVVKALEWDLKMKRSSRTKDARKTRRKER